MKNWLASLFLNVTTLCSLSQITIAGESHINQLKEMFEKVTIKKNEKAISRYYDKDFVLYSNGKQMDFNSFSEMHRDVYKTAIHYRVHYDDKTFVEQGNRVAGRLFITTQMPNESAHEIEVILIAEYKENKILRLWELTYPDWSKIKDFEKITE